MTATFFAMKSMLAVKQLRTANRPSFRNIKMNTPQPPPVRKERKIPHLELAWQVTDRICTIAIYKYDATGWLRLIRVQHGCKVWD